MHSSQWQSGYFTTRMPIHFNSTVYWPWPFVIVMCYVQATHCPAITLWTEKFSELSVSKACISHLYIYPYLIYCNQAWGSACKPNIEPLFILQKRALIIITGVHHRSPSEPLFGQLKYLNCQQIFKYLVGRFMYGVYHEELTTLQFLFIKNIDIHMHDTHQRGH